MEEEPSNVVRYPTSRLAVISFVAGLLAIWPFRLLAAIPAIVCGHIALREIKAAEGKMAGKAYAIFGMVVGYIDLLLLIFALITLHFLAKDVQHLLLQLQSAQASH